MAKCTSGVLCVLWVKSQLWTNYHEYFSVLVPCSLPKRWDPKWSSDLKTESWMVKTQFCFQMSRVNGDQWWSFRILMCIPMTILGLIFSHDLANLKSGLFSHEPFEKRPVMIMQDSDLCFDDHSRSHIFKWFGKPEIRSLFKWAVWKETSDGDSRIPTCILIKILGLVVSATGWLDLPVPWSLTLSVTISIPVPVPVLVSVSILVAVNVPVFRSRSLSF